MPAMKQQQQLLHPSRNEAFRALLLVLLAAPAAEGLSSSALRPRAVAAPAAPAASGASGVRGVGEGGPAVSDAAAFLLSARGAAGEAKPPKIYVGDRSEDVDKQREKMHPLTDKLEALDNFTKVLDKAGSELECAIVHKVDSSSSKRDWCPEACPFFAQDRTDENFCTFACVREQDCREMFPNAQIGDRELKVCRSCVVDGCNKCDISVTEDRCAECQAGYVLQPDGTCHFKYLGPVAYTIGALLGVAVLLLMAWVLDMSLRPLWNQEGFQEGVDSRLAMKFHWKDESTGERKLFPLGTNVHTTMVAGPAMTLHFNFQLAVIVWAIFVASVWMCFAHFVDRDLWRLGTRKYGTPRDNCILVAWGYETQQRLMWTKVSFLWIVYSVTCVMIMVFCVYQYRRYQDLDYTRKTMKDFAAMIVGLPPIEGSKPVEEDLKKAVQDWSGQEVVGTSVAWIHKDQEEEVETALKDHLIARLAEIGTPNPEPCREAPEMGAVRRYLWDTEQKLLGLMPEDKTTTPRSEETAIKDLLAGLTTAKRAVVVFNTEAGRDAAVEKATSQPLIVEGRPVELLEVDAEPETVQWSNFGHVTPEIITTKLLLGFGIILLACLFWAVVFYAPYAYYVLTFNYENGRQPGFVVGLSFSMIVVIGNAIMYEVCGRIADWVGFRFRDSREACYMILYTVACMSNVALDFVTTYITAETIMEELGFRTYFGVKLEDVNSFTVKFETYGMQRALAENTFTYAFPSTFLIPFLIEWIPTITLPYVLGKLIVKSHPEVRGLDAEAWMEMLPMDMGRYADILLNIILAVLIFYFPGGYTWTLFLGLAGSHMWIYAFDYYKVLRQIPAVSYVNFDLEWWCQALLAPIVGIMASCLVFKSNCEAGYHCLEGWRLIAACFAAWLLHVVVHICLLVYGLPLCGKTDPKLESIQGLTYADTAPRIAANWFSTNPVNCLRSKYFYEHSPPCDFHVLGKERLQRTNPRIGCYFNTEAVKSQP